MTINKTALREYRATLGELENALATARVRAERDDVPPVMGFYVGLAKAKVSRLRFLFPYLDAPPAGGQKEA